MAASLGLHVILIGNLFSAMQYFSALSNSFQLTGVMKWGPAVKGTLVNNIGYQSNII